LLFTELNLIEPILSALEAEGYTNPTPIQQKAIPPVLAGKDLLGCAQTGTGKTAAFAIPMLNNIANRKAISSIILAPTRELAIQVHDELVKLAKYEKLNVVAVYGGAPIHNQIRDIKKANIVVGTPGRVLDHIRRGTLPLDSVEFLVLDEADEMLDMGFREDIEMILSKTPEERQTTFFSATMPKGILELTKKYQKNPEHIKVVRKELTVPNIKQYYIETRSANKLEVLSRLIDVYNPKLSVVFTNTKKGADELVSDLQARGYFADALHGDLKQTQRDIVMDKFRNGTIDILVATDVAARGIDVDDVEAVFNYDLTQDAKLIFTGAVESDDDFTFGLQVNINTGKWRVTGVGSYQDVDITNKELFINKSWTLSYGYQTQSWISWHSYQPQFMMYDTRSLYTCVDNGVWKHLHDGNYQTFYGKKYDFIVEYVNSNPVTQNVNTVQYHGQSLYLDKSSDQWVEVRDKTFDRMLVYNQYHSTGLQNLNLILQDVNPYGNLGYSSNTKNVIRTDKNYKIGQIYDMSIQQPIVSSDWNLIQSEYDNGQGYIDIISNDINIDYNRPQRNLRQLKDKWFKTRLYFKPEEDIKKILFFTTTNTENSIR